MAKHRVRFLPKGHPQAEKLESLPNFSAKKSLAEIRSEQGSNALFVRSGAYVYNCEEMPDIYHKYAH